MEDKTVTRVSRLPLIGHIVKLLQVRLRALLLRTPVCSTQIVLHALGQTFSSIVAGSPCSASAYLGRMRTPYDRTKGKCQTRRRGNGLGVMAATFTKARTTAWTGSRTRQFGPRSFVGGVASSAFAPEALPGAHPISAIPQPGQVWDGHGAPDVVQTNQSGARLTGGGHVVIMITRIQLRLHAVVLSVRVAPGTLPTTLCAGDRMASAKSAGDDSSLYSTATSVLTIYNDDMTN